MIRITFPEADVQRINFLRYHDPRPRVRRRMEVLWLKSQGRPHQEICRLADVCPTTSRQYLRLYAAGGVERLLGFHFYAPSSELEAHRDDLIGYFRAHPPATLNEAAQKIEERTGLKRSPSAVGRFLHGLGMAPRKVGALPSEGEPEKQEAFRINQLEPRIEAAKRGERAFFVGAAHFVLGAFLGVLWSMTRLFVKASAGRRRFNLLGALNAITHELIVVTNDTYIAAESVCALLRKIAALNLSVPITLVLDNAAYQRCALVKALAAELDIELLFLPAYSPNLNLIERLWKFVKKKVLYSRYYPDFPRFKHAIVDCLAQTHTTHKHELDTLLTLNFQTFKKCKFVPT